MGNRIVIIDGNSLINRAYYAMQRPMITKDGIYTQGIYGFINMLTKIEEDYAPDYMAVAWDMKAPTFRHKAYSEYKAGRKKMPPELAMEMPIIKDVLDAMNITNLELEGFEADDIIGTVARLSEEDGLSPLIITGDKDALQLATDKTKVLITKKGISEFDLYDRDKMLERYQLTPEQFIDLKGLMGDQSDNIPGIPGVGEKTGIKLLLQFGSIGEMIANTDQIKGQKLREKVEDNIQLAVMSRKLAEINRFVPLDINIEDFKTEEPDYDRLIDLYVKLEFNNFLKKLRKNGGQTEEESAVSLDLEKYTRITDFDKALAELNSAESGSELIIKVFSDGNHVEMPQIYGIAMITGDTFLYFDTDSAEKTDSIISVLNEKDFVFRGHDLVGDYFALMMHGMKNAKTGFDTALAQYVIDPAKSNYSIRTLAFENFHIDMPEEKDVMAENSQVDLLGASSSGFADYGILWCAANDLIAQKQSKTLEENDLVRVFSQVELPLVEVLASMEASGFDVDRDILSGFGEDLKSRISDTEQKIYALAGEEFNINSTQQLGEILFEKLGLPAGKKTKRGYSTSAEVLEKLKDKHPVIDLVLEYRTLSKLNSTYVEGMTHLIGSDGRIRAHFRQTVAATGRISCTEPNLQNIPVRSDLGRQLRKAFVAGCDDCTLVGADYSQIELRVLAHLSGDENLINAFNNGDDIHRITASRVFNIDYDKVTPLDRSRAKAVNFGVIYGMSGFGLSEELHITRKEAENYINDYFSKHAAVKAYMNSQIEGCKLNGYTETVMGRKRYINEINSSAYMTRQLGERLAMNSPIQGSAADIIKIAMIKVYRELRDRNFKSELILQVHDELIIRTSKDELEEVKELLVRNMEEAMELKVKLISDLNEGYSWYELK